MKFNPYKVNLISVSELKFEIRSNFLEQLLTQNFLEPLLTQNFVDNPEDKSKYYLQKRT